MSDETDSNLSKPLKSCSTCERREGSGKYARCNYTGFFCEVERKDWSGMCGLLYEGWIPRRSLVARVREYFTGAAK